MISCIVPAFNEEKYISKCLDSLFKSASMCLEEVEIIVVNNHCTDRTEKIVKMNYPGVRCLYYPISGREGAKNYGAYCSQGDPICFVDADCLVSEDFFSEIGEKAVNEHFIGGGTKYVKLSRMSLGIFIGLIPVAITLLLNGITVGAFWVRREVFEAVKGFRTTTWDDINFAIKLKKFAKEHGKKFESLKKSNLVWSTRKADRFGDFYWVCRSRQIRNATA